MELAVILDGARAITGVHALSAIGVLLVGGYFLGRLAGGVRLPELTGYILAGLLVGPGGFHIMPLALENAFLVLSQAALMVIAFTIGAEFYWPKLKRVGVQVLVMGFLEMVGSFVLVTSVMRLLGVPWAFASILGAISAATAPAATVAIVQSLRARGRFIDMLYGLVALDDAGAVILFAIVFAVAGDSLVPGMGPGLGTLVLHALQEIGLSIVAGFVVGLIIHRLSRTMPNTHETLIFCLGLLLLLAGLAQGFGYSLLLAGMATGTTYVNLARGDQRLFRHMEPITPPLYALFFVIAGIELQPAILLRPESLILGGGYILARSLGKYGGTYLGASVTAVDPRIRNYIGLSMLPQAGVALGLVLLVRSSPIMQALPPGQQVYVGMLINVTLFSVLVSELVGPPISRLAILRGNDMEESWNS